MAGRGKGRCFCGWSAGQEPLPSAQHVSPRSFWNKTLSSFGRLSLHTDVLIRIPTANPREAVPGYRVGSGMHLGSMRVDGTQALGQKLPGRDAVFPLELEGRSPELPEPGSRGGPAPE